MGYSAVEQISGQITGAPGINTKTSQPQALSRYFGGHSRTSHPYVNGYWQFFLSPPCKLFDKVDEMSDIWFHATAEGFTPPSRNLNKADLPGQGGVGSSWVTGQSLMRTFSITHREYRDLPMMKLYELWGSTIVPQTGVSEFKGTEWQSTLYKGHAFVILTTPTGNNANADWRPNADDIEEVYYFDGVWPENVPTDALAQDISSNDIVQYTMNFSFDGWPLTGTTDPSVVSKAVSMFESYNYKYQTTYNLNVNDMDVFATGCLKAGQVLE